MKWNAWTDLKGTPNRECADKFLEAMLPIVKEFNLDITNPRKAHMDQMYEDCVQAEIAKGKNRAQVEAAANKY